MAAIRIALFGCVAACVLCFASGAQFPKFKSIPETYNKRNIQPAVTYIYPILPQPWYASWPTSMRMTVLGKGDIRSFSLYCYTNTLESDSHLTEMEFCFDGKCEKMTSPASVTRSVQGPRGKISVTQTFARDVGGVVTYPRSVYVDQDISTKFYCVVRNAMGSLQSNTLQIMDFRSRFPKTLWVVPNVPPSAISKKGPYTFKCLNNAVAPGAEEPPYNINWWFCSKSGQVEPHECSSVQLSNVIQSEGNKWPAHIRANGDLYVPFFSDGAVQRLNNHKLVCKMNSERVAIYKNPLTFHDKPSPDEIKSLKMVRPLRTEKVAIFNSESTSVVFPCNFEMGPGSFSLTWKFLPRGGGTQTAITTSPANGVGLVGWPQSLKFKGPFNDKTAGTYTCEVSWTPQSGGANQVVTGSYDVEVKFFPTVSDKMVPLKYVVDGDDGVVKCLFNGLLVKPSLAINGESLDLKSVQALNDGIKTVNNMFKKVMSSLSVKVSPMNPTPGKIITYTVEKMDYKNAMNNLPSSHTVQCIGTNEVGSVRANTLLKVVPKPALTVGKGPSNFNCTECSAAEAHTIHCEVANMAAINSSGVVFGQYWMLGKQRVDSLLSVPDAPARKYLDVSTSNSLTIKKIDDEDFKKVVNTLGVVECVLTLAYPASATKLPPEVKTTGVEKNIFFVSSHTAMSKELRTTIKLTNIAPPLKTGSMMWVIPVILALIVILIIIGATYYCCRQRQSGEEYNVDAKEKQQGNDPEVEVAEKEAFPVFERPEDGPIRGSRASLDDSIHVGSDDEDEVLAEYDVDIGKFDEEGSFIGQYAVNDGNATGNRRLPQVGNNTEV